MNWTVLWSKLKALEGKVDSLEIISFEPVTELPETGERNIIYLVPKSDPETGNYSDEYIWDSENETFEKIGDTQIAPIEDYIKNSSIAPLYDNTSTYAVGDIVAYEKELYKCKTAIGTAEEFDPTKWDKTNVIAEMAGIERLPDVTASDNGKVLGIVNGVWNKTNKSDLIILRATSEAVFNPLNQISLVNWQPSTISGITKLNYQNYILIVKEKEKNGGVNDNVIFYPCDYKPNYGIYFKGHIERNGVWYTYKVQINNGDYLHYKTCYPIYEENIPDVDKDSSVGKLLGVVSGLPNSSGKIALVNPTPNANPNIAPTYSASSTYNLGDLVIYNNNLYECTTAIPAAEAWTAAHWTAKKVADELANKANISDIPADYTKDTAVTALYDSTSTYELGDIVMYNKELYECTTAIPVAEEWDSTHWTKTDIFSKMPTPVPAVTDYAKDSSVAPLYDSTATYAVGNKVVYNNELYKCTTAISTAEEWDSTHWTKTNIIESIPKELPEVTSADAGKMAIVDSNGEWTAQLGPFQQTVTGTLEAGETSITLSHANITTDSVLDIYTDTYGVNPTAVTVAAGSVTLTFEAQASDLGVKVRFFTDVPIPPMNGNVTIFMSTAVTAESAT